MIETILNNKSFSDSSFNSFSGIHKDILEKIWKTKTDLRKYINDVQVAYSQISSVSWQLSATLAENDAFTQKLFDTTKEVTVFNKLTHENVDVTTSEVRSILTLVETLNHYLEQMKATSMESHQIQYK